MTGTTAADRRKDASSSLQFNPALRMPGMKASRAPVKAAAASARAKMARVGNAPGTEAVGPESITAVTRADAYICASPPRLKVPPRKARLAPVPARIRRARHVERVADIPPG